MFCTDSQEEIYLEKKIKKYSPVRSQKEDQLTKNTAFQAYEKLFQNVIHDLKNPIGNILGVVYLLETDLQREEDKELLEIIKKSCNNALSILNSLLEEQKNQENLNLEKISINRLIKECLTDVTGSLALKNIGIKHQALQHELYILSDIQMLKRAFLNIITNAIKFSLPGGIIRIYSRISGNKLHISIEDKGIGIPESQQDHIFEKFTSAQRTGTNGETASGLGLYFTRESILKHHGNIWFKSVENEGSTFHVEFDLDQIGA